MTRQTYTSLAIVLAVGVTAVSMGFLGGRHFRNLPREISKKPEGVDLTLDAAELNKTLPEMVSEGVRLDRTSGGPGNQFHYFYTILDEDQARAIVSVPGRLREIVSQLNERVCGMMPNYVKNGVVVTYHLSSHIDAALPMIVVDPGECGASQAGR